MFEVIVGIVAIGVAREVANWDDVIEFVNNVNSRPMSGCVVAAVPVLELKGPAKSS